MRCCGPSGDQGKPDPALLASKIRYRRTVRHLPIDLIEGYALRELSETEMRRVEKHVASCPKCQFMLEEQLGWAAAMRSPFRRMVEKMIKEERKKRAAKS